jgi:hypothetical protein
MTLRYVIALPISAVAVGITLGACTSSPSASTTTTTSGVSTTSSTSPTTSSSTATTAVSTTTTAPANGLFDSCSVVTESEAAAAIGSSVSSGVLGHATVEGGLACVFYGPAAPTPHDPDVAQADSVRVVVVKGSDALKWYDDYKASASAKPGLGTISLNGYGQQAFYDGYASLSVMDGPYYVRIAVSPEGAPPSLTDEEKLASAILPTLPGA